jgi:AmpE protein
MKFLTILVVVLIYKNWLGGHPLREIVSVDGWFGWVKDVVRSETIRFVVAVVVPSLLLLWISVEMTGWLLGLVYLALSIVVVLYAVDIIDLDVLFDDHRLWLRTEDTSEAAKEQQQDSFRTDIIYESFQSIVPSLFWFLCLGPAGALLYVLSEQYLNDLSDEDEAFPFADQLLYWMEWIPARISGLLFAVLGDFRRGLSAFVDTMADTQSGIALTLREVADGAAGQKSADTDEELEDLRWMVEANLWGWVGLTALLTIAGW